MSNKPISTYYVQKTWLRFLQGFERPGHCQVDTQTLMQKRELKACMSLQWKCQKNVLFLEKLITLLLLLTLLASTPQTQGESMFQRRKSFLWIKTLFRNNSRRGDVLKRSNICCDGFAWLQKFWGYHSPCKFFMCLWEKNHLRFAWSGHVEACHRLTFSGCLFHINFSAFSSASSLSREWYV